MWFVGVMTGTSIDGLDLALLDLPNDLRPHASKGVALPEELQHQLVALTVPGGTNEIDRLGEADIRLGQFIADTVVDFLAGNSIDPKDVRAIGSHGQTIRHDPDAEYAFTVQIGSGHTIAELTGIDVIADFRPRDIAAGGQGAPLVPIYHDRLFRDPDKSCAVINIGGIANVSILRPESDAAFGFDTGPGNALIDAWIDRCLDKPFDANGDWANTGRVNAALLNQLLDDPFFSLAPPKSTGKQHFNLTYVTRTLETLPPIDQVNVQATLSELTTRTITAALEEHASDVKKIILCGGGRLNTDLKNRLSRLNPDRTIVNSEAMGIDGDSLEAAAFAYLAWLFTERLPGNVPQVTGAKGKRVLGVLYPGAKDD